MKDKNIIELDFTEFRNMLIKFRREYQTVKEMNKYLSPIDKSFSTLLDLHKAGKITPYKKIVKNRYSLWLTFDKAKVSLDEEKLIHKIAKFLLKIEAFLKENNII